MKKLRNFLPENRDKDKDGFSRLASVSAGTVIGFLVGVVAWLVLVVGGLGLPRGSSELVVFAFIPLASGVAAGVLRADKTAEGALVGVGAGVLVLVLGLTTAVLNAVLIGAPGEPIDFTVETVAGYVIIAAAVGVSSVPFFALLGAVGGLAGSAVVSRI